MRWVAVIGAILWIIPVAFYVQTNKGTFSGGLGLGAGYVDCSRNILLGRKGINNVNKINSQH